MNQHSQWPLGTGVKRVWRFFRDAISASFRSGWQFVRLLRSGLPPGGFPVAGVVEERCHPAPQRTVCRTGSSYYNPPRCFACSIVSWPATASPGDSSVPWCTALKS